VAGIVHPFVIVQLAKRKARTGYVSPYGIALLYADLGDQEHAFEWLNSAYQEHDNLPFNLRTDFTFDSLRSDPCYAELVHKIGLQPGAPSLRVWFMQGWGWGLVPQRSSLERAMGIELTSEARRPAPEPRADSMALRLVRSKNTNQVRPEAPVAGLITRSPSPAEGHPAWEDPCGEPAWYVHFADSCAITVRRFGSRGNCRILAPFATSDFASSLRPDLRTEFLRNEGRSTCAGAVIRASRDACALR
jgi:hypothetical protein